MVDSREYRQTIGQFATGVTVVVNGRAEDAHAMTANAVMSLSLDPVQVVIAVKKESKMARRLAEDGRFTINILNEKQRDLSNYFANFWREEEPPDFTFLPWGGCARLEGCLAALQCETAVTADGGDHWLIIGRVAGLYRAANGANPLIYYGGGYRTLCET